MPRLPSRRAALGTALLGTVLLAACAAPGPLSDDMPLIDRVRQDVRLEPMLESSRVTVVERDDIIVFGGTVDSLEDLDIVRDIIDDYDEDVLVENNVVIKGGGDGSDGDS